MKRLLPILILMVLSTSIHAQYKPVLFGLRVGGNLGWMKADADGYSGEGVVPGFSWGFMGEFFLMENYAILTGFNMNFNGGELKYPSYSDINNDDILDSGMLTRRYSLKYIQIPLCLKMQTNISEKMRIFGKIGIGTAFLLDGKAKDDFVYDGGTLNDDKKDINDEITLMRESLIVGGGVEFILKGSTALVVDLTYDNGFNNILLEGNPPSNVTPRAFHNYVELGVGILF
jgi:hypothetical protein